MSANESKASGMTLERLKEIALSLQPKSLTMQQALLLNLNPKKYGSKPVELPAKDLLQILELAIKALQAPQGGTWPSEEEFRAWLKHFDEQRSLAGFETFMRCPEPWECFRWLTSQYRPQVSQVSANVTQDAQSNTSECHKELCHISEAEIEAEALKWFGGQSAYDECCSLSFKDGARWALSRGK